MKIFCSFFYFNRNFKPLISNFKVSNFLHSYTKLDVWKNFEKSTDYQTPLKYEASKYQMLLAISYAKQYLKVFQIPTQFERKSFLCPQPSITYLPHLFKEHRITLIASVRSNRRRLIKFMLPQSTHLRGSKKNGFVESGAVPRRLMPPR